MRPTLALTLAAMVAILVGMIWLLLLPVTLLLVGLAKLQSLTAPHLQLMAARIRWAKYPRPRRRGARKQPPNGQL